MELTIITGMSGAGKSAAMGVYEDAGWFCIDNLPPRLLPGLADLFALEGAPVSRVAVACDLRGGVWFDELSRQLGAIELAEGVTARMLFLEASDDTLLNRFRETRRRHPLATGGSVLAAIDRERQLLADIRGRADAVIDTTGLNIWDMRRLVDEQIVDAGKRPGLSVDFVSFGFKHGALREAELLFDVRFLPNPFYVSELAGLTGLDSRVAEYVLGSPGMVEFRDRLESLLDLMIPAYAREGRSHLVIGIGCTGGRHRSVAIAELLAGRYRLQGFAASTTHRDVTRPG